MNKPPTELSDEQIEGVSGNGSDFGSGDIETLIYTVMAQATKTEADLLKSTMHDMQLANAHKAHRRP